MKNRNGIRTEINAFYRSKLIGWLADHIRDDKATPADFPVHLYLGAPQTEEEIQACLPEFKNFCEDWKQPLSSGHIETQDKDVEGLGRVKVPLHLVFDTPEDIATWAGHLVEYRTSVERLDVIAKQTPALIESALDVISSITNLDANDFIRFVEVTKWILENHENHSLIRQIPVRGVDTRWFEIHRPLLLDYLRDKLQLNPKRKDLLQFGLIPPPSIIRVTVLDHVIRNKVGGMRHFATTADELEKLQLKPQRVVFLDNIATSLTLPDIPGTVLIITPTSSLAEVCKVSWVANARTQYFGSIDLKSFAILHNLRIYLPRLESVLMDEATLLENQDLCTYDDPSILESIPSALTIDEQILCKSMADGLYSPGIRLDQERIPLDSICRALGAKLDKSALDNREDVFLDNDEED